MDRFNIGRFAMFESVYIRKFYRNNTRNLLLRLGLFHCFTNNFKIQTFMLHSDINKLLKIIT